MAGCPEFEAQLGGTETTLSLPFIISKMGLRNLF